MIVQERTLFWQIVRLRLRVWTGWGYDVRELRQYVRFYAIMSKGVPVFFTAILILFIVIFDIFPRVGIGDTQPLAAPAVLRIFSPLIGVCLLLTLLSAGLGAVHRRRANAGESQPPTTLDGFCYTTVIAPPARLFARIGMTREQARWFCLPIEWDMRVERCNDRFELTYNPATGYVERLRRIGAEPRELTQAAQAPSDAGEAAAVDATDGEATPAQRRELKRAVRRAGMAWGVSTRTLLSDGLAFVVGGVSVIAMIVVVLIVLRAYPQPHAGTATTLRSTVLCGVLGIIGIGLLVWAARILGLWARRRDVAAAPVVIEGTQVCWAPYRDIYSSRNESLALTRLDDGSKLVFRIPGRWAHRLWSANSRVRVTYDATSGHVVDYRVLATA